MVHWKESRKESLCWHVLEGETLMTGRSHSHSRSLLCGISFTGEKNRGGTLMAREKILPNSDPAAISTEMPLGMARQRSEPSRALSKPSAGIPSSMPNSWICK